jgi:apolipoprotein N-acyltransferase
MKLFKKKQQKIKEKINLKYILISGIAFGLCFPPIPFPFFLFFAIAPFLWVLYQSDKSSTLFKATYVWGFIVNLITLYWVGSWSKEADPFLMLSGGVLLFFNPLTFFIPVYAYHLASKFINKAHAIWLLPFFWIAYEYLYSITDFRFPWLSIGNSAAYFNSYIQILDVVGISGLGVLILLTNISLLKTYLAYKNKTKTFKINLIVFIVLILLPISYGTYKIATYKEPNKTIKVGLIQPNLNPWNKWEAGNTENQLNLYFNLSDYAVNKKAQVLFYPETALPVYLLDGRNINIVNKIKKYCDTNNVVLFTGMPHIIYYFGKNNIPKDAKLFEGVEAGYQSYNSVIRFIPNNNSADFYGKMMLVPFGEKVPLVEYIPLLGDLIKWEVGISSWNTGKDTVVFNTPIKINNKPDSVKIASVICIESIYSQFVSSFVKKGAELIAIVTNDSWYGNSSGPYQHQAISLLRAVENRRYVVRAANGGISCIINPLGVTVKKTKMFTKDTITGDVGINNYLTFYTKNPFIVSGISLILFIFVFVINILRKIKAILKI